MSTSEDDHPPLPALSPSKWFTEEVLPHEAALRAWLIARFGPDCEVDDLVQETFARLLEASFGVAVQRRADGALVLRRHE